MLKSRNREGDPAGICFAAIATGESIINRFYDDYGKAFRAQVLQQWSILVGLIGTLLGLTILVQKQKD